MSKFRGYWSFAPMDECTTHTIEAKNEDEAVEKLAEWAHAHRNWVDEPWDFEVEELTDLTLVDRLRTFMYCAYGDHADYIDEELLKDKEKIKILINILRTNIADNLRALAKGIDDEQQEYGIDYNTEVDFALLLELKTLYNA